MSDARFYVIVAAEVVFWPTLALFAYWSVRNWLDDRQTELELALARKGGK